ncbi:MAG: HEAT repeat domain-containing protein [Candidatus Hodarchaeota archaeon]
MKEELTPEKIHKNYLNGDINKEDSVDLLISLIDGSEDAKVRVASIEALRKIEYKDEKIFKILENHLVSDENANVRASAAEVIILNHLEEGLEPLKWTIQHDKSPLVLNVIFKIFERNKKVKYEILEGDLSHFLSTFASNLGVQYEEARFFLDLEAIFAKDKRNYEINPLCYKNFEVLYNWKDSEPWLVIKNEHVEVLNLNFFNWKFVKDNEELINSFSKLKYLDMYLNMIRKYNNFNFNHTVIPESIGRLIYLKKLVLARNNLNSIPGSIKNLNLLSELDLSHNHFQEIPQILKSLNSLERLNLKNNNIKSTSQRMKDFINSLADFKL